MSSLIRPSELHAVLSDPSLRVVDVRFDLGDTSAGEEAYREAHIPGAVYAHLDRDLSAPLGKHGGRHPLPDPHRLAARLGELGIGDQDLVVAYDGGNGMVASRLWWLLRYLGSQRAKVLDGGFSAWLEAGLPVTDEVPNLPSTRFEPRVRSEMAVDRDYVMGRLDDRAAVLVDARAPERYRGENEPLDPIAGHIPSAVNYPFQENLAGGRFRSPEELRRHYADLAGAEDVVVYCGSGVSAAHDVLAMEEAGLSGVKLYHGSWSDWCSYDDPPVATGDGPEASDA